MFSMIISLVQEKIFWSTCECIDSSDQFIQMIHDFEVKLKEKFWLSDLSSTKQLCCHEIFQIVVIENDFNKI